MDFSGYKTDFDRDGFVVVRGFLTGEDFAELGDNLDRYIRDVVPHLSDADAFYEEKSRPETLKQMQHMGANDPFFARYRQRPRWTALAEALLCESVDPQEPEWFNKPPGMVHPTPPHQDNYYFNLKPPNTVSIWLALDPRNIAGTSNRSSVLSRVMKSSPRRPSLTRTVKMYVPACHGS